MESPPVVVERERVNSSSGFRRHKLLFGAIVIVGVLFYAAFNVWVWRVSTSGKTATGLNPVKKQGSTLPESVLTIGTPQPPAPSPTPTPAPRPTGPGQYACSPEGDCNVYSDAARTQYCTTTYADNKCLDLCGEKEKQCKK